jgi:NAD(P)-dependent dehydrogenase (short-subunit alcohol dehydrogenase family)
MILEPGQVAVVTGGASGVGLALGAALARRGLTVCLLDVEAGPLQAAAEAIGAAAHVCDVSDAAAVSRVAADILARHGRVDLLINNAGVGGLLGPMWHSPPQDWAWVFGVNVFGVVNGISAFTPAMIAAGSGHILNVASLAGLTDPPFLATYAASKHAVIGLSESLAAEFAAMALPIRVSVACPGNVESAIRQADRNRPSSLRAASSASPEMLSRIEGAFDGIIRQGMISAEEAARRILDGVERGDLHILTHPDMLAPARARVARLEAAFAAAG